MRGGGGGREGAVGGWRGPLSPPRLPRISGNAASDKNIKDGVCAQIEKNFARAKWKVGGRHSVPQFPLSAKPIPQPQGCQPLGATPPAPGKHPRWGTRRPGEGPGEHPCPTASHLSPHRKPCE